MAGYDGMSARVLRALHSIISLPIAHIINLSFKVGVSPQALKDAVVTPIHEGKSKLDISKFRPVSVLIALSKVSEKSMYNHLYSFLNSQNISYKDQYGFCAIYLTDLALLEFWNSSSKPGRTKRL